MKLLITMISVVTLTASSALTQPYAPQRLERPTISPDGGIHISVARATAIRECSARAAQYLEYESGNRESYQYRVCMNEHGQVE